MPLTFPAHQAGVLPLKIWKPRWFDGLALVVGSGSPDLFIVLEGNAAFAAHSWSGVVVAVVFAISYSMMFRRFGADGLFSSLPDFGLLRARSYRVLQAGRPRFLVTAFSALIGVLNHILIDSFTHANRPIAQALGLDQVAIDEPIPITWAKLLQYLGHTVGSMIGLLLFVLVVSKRHLGEWYGEATIEACRAAPARPHARRVTSLIVLAGMIFGLVWGQSVTMFPIFHIGFCAVISLLIAGVVNTPPLNSSLQRTQRLPTPQPPKRPLRS